MMFYLCRNYKCSEFRYQQLKKITNKYLINNSCRLNTQNSLKVNSNFFKYYDRFMYLLKNLEKKKKLLKVPNKLFILFKNKPTSFQDQEICGSPCQRMLTGLYTSANQQINRLLVSN